MTVLNLVNYIQAAKDAGINLQAFALEVLSEMYLNEGEIDQDKELSGADFIEYVSSRALAHGATPEQLGLTRAMIQPCEPQFTFDVSQPLQDYTDIKLDTIQPENIHIGIDNMCHYVNHQAGLAVGSFDDSEALIRLRDKLVFNAESVKRMRALYLELYMHEPNS